MIILGLNYDFIKFGRRNLLMFYIVLFLFSWYSCYFNPIIFPAIFVLIVGSYVNIYLCFGI